MNIKKSLLETVGSTPLVELSRFSQNYKTLSPIIAKIESFNPYSVKDRVAVEMLLDAQNSGKLKKGDTIIEPTSGNTGIGLAFASSILGYKLVLVMPESMSVERRKILSQLGAELVLTDKAKGMSGSIEKAKEIQAINGGFIPSQFDNPSNIMAHIKTTAKEIYSDTDGKIDIFVAGVGTGGTISGVGRVLKDKNPNVYIVAVEPEESAVLSGESAGVHGIQGIGAGFVPKNFDRSVVDEIIKVPTKNAIECSKNVAKLEGLLVGISSGATLSASVSIAKRQGNENKNIVVLLPDSGERYLSTALFEQKISQ